MTWVDAVIHAFSTMGLGGFSSHDASFGHFDSPAIEAVAPPSCSPRASISPRTSSPCASAPSRPYVARRRGAARADLDGRAPSIGIAAFLVAQGTYPDFATALRHASFNVVSIASTTGFASVDYAQWPWFAPIWMIFLSCFATSSGSTGGGIKMVRAVVLFKQAIREMTRIIHPRAVVPVKYGDQVIENNVIFAVLAFMLMYGTTIIAMTMLLLATGMDPVTAITRGRRLHQQHGPGPRARRARRRPTRC